MNFSEAYQSNERCSTRQAGVRAGVLDHGVILKLRQTHRSERALSSQCRLRLGCCRPRMLNGVNVFVNGREETMHNDVMCRPCQIGIDTIYFLFLAYYAYHYAVFC